MASLSLPPVQRPVRVAPSASANKTASGDKNGSGSSGALTTLSGTGRQSTNSRTVQRAPSYEQRCQAAAEVSRMTVEERRQRKERLFCPRALEDFDDGGAFPEIHVAQYPRHMGNPHLKQSKVPASATDSSKQRGGPASTSRALVNVEIDKDGQVSYDALVKSGTNKDKIVYSKLEDMQGGDADPDDIRLPSQQEQEQATQRTKAALARLVATQTALDKPDQDAAKQAADTTRNFEQQTKFIQYTPRPDAPGYNPAAAQRVIQMVPAKVDPLLPPKHKHIKAPRGPAEDPVPVLHAPPTKLTKEERDAWNIPACISNWKNTRGYTIPLDKRLAADGRGLRDETTINANFATLSESLYVAERQARQEVKMRAQVQQKLALQEREQREQELRKLANQARLERSGTASTTTAEAPHDSTDPQPDNTVDSPADAHVVVVDDDETDEQVAAQQRERLRMERKREREKELRMEKAQAKKQRLEQERDVSEKIALGVSTGTGGGADGGVDARLYSQSAGMDSGFGKDDDYNTYTKPLFDRQGVTSASIYRPTRGETEYNADEQYQQLKQGGTSKFQPDKGFAGAEGGGPVSAGPRTAPVQFEKET